MFSARFLKSKRWFWFHWSSFFIVPRMAFAFFFFKLQLMLYNEIFTFNIKTSFFLKLYLWFSNIWHIIVYFHIRWHHCTDSLRNQFLSSPSNFPVALCISAYIHNVLNIVIPSVIIFFFFSWMIYAALGVDFSSCYSIWVREVFFTLGAL